MLKYFEILYYQKYRIGCDVPASKFNLWPESSRFKHASAEAM